MLSPIFGIIGKKGSAKGTINTKKIPNVKISAVLGTTNANKYNSNPKNKWNIRKNHSNSKILSILIFLPSTIPEQLKQMQQE